MVIRFLCPNGHQLSAPESVAGKAGKCPKCGTAFAVPTLEEMAEMSTEESTEPQTGDAEPAPETTPPSAEALSSSGAFDLSQASNAVGVGSGTGSGTKQVFVFLCPNGHKLNGPPSLKGKAGKCPHCGAKFRIPSDEDLIEPEPEPVAEPELAEAVEENQDLIMPPLEDMEELEPEAEEEEVGDEELEVYVDPPLAEGHALGYVFARLWDQRTDDTQVELYLKEGEILAPDYYCDNLSCREYGVFANKDGDENYSFTLIPWDDVRKINVRRIPILPRPMFR